MDPVSAAAAATTTSLTAHRSGVRTDKARVTTDVTVWQNELGEQFVKEERDAMEIATSRDAALREKGHDLSMWEVFVYKLLLSNSPPFFAHNRTVAKTLKRPS